MSNPGISAILLSWRRVENVHAIIAALATCPDVKEIIVWNNNAEARFEPRSSVPNLKVVQSSHNFLCPARYALPSIAAHDTILFNDDDILVAPEHIARLYERARAKPSIITGIVGRNLENGRYSMEAAYGLCDIVLGQFMIFDKRLLASVYRDLLALGPHVRGDDIAFSLLCGTRHQAIDVPFTDLGMFDDHALWREPGHLELRQEMVDRVLRLRRGQPVLRKLARVLDRRLGRRA